MTPEQKITFMRRCVLSAIHYLPVGENTKQYLETGDAKYYECYRDEILLLRSKIELNPSNETYAIKSILNAAIGLTAENPHLNWYTVHCDICWAVGWLAFNKPGNCTGLEVLTNNVIEKMYVIAAEILTKG